MEGEEHVGGLVDTTNWVMMPAPEEIYEKNKMKKAVRNRNKLSFKQMAKKIQVRHNGRSGYQIKLP